MLVPFALADNLPRSGASNLPLILSHPSNAAAPDQFIIDSLVELHRAADTMKSLLGPILLDEAADAGHPADFVLTNAMTIAIHLPFGQKFLVAKMASAVDLHTTVANNPASVPAVTIHWSCNSSDLSNASFSSLLVLESCLDIGSVLAH